MEVQRIGVDVDSVLAHLAQAAVWRYNAQYRPPRLTKEEPLALEAWDSWNMHEKLGLSYRELHSLFDNAWRLWDMMPEEEPDLGISLLRLHKYGHRVHILTNRNRATAHFVMQWLVQHGMYFDAISFNCEPGVSKFEYPIDMLIDDDPNKVKDVPEGKTLLLRDQPWNRDVQCPHILHPIRLVRNAVVPEPIPQWGAVMSEAGPEIIYRPSRVFRIDNLAQAVDILTDSSLYLTRR